MESRWLKGRLRRSRRHYESEFYDLFRDLKREFRGECRRECKLLVVPRERLKYQDCDYFGDYHDGVIRVATNLSTALADDTLIHEFSHHLDDRRGGFRGLCGKCGCDPPCRRFDHRCSFGQAYACCLRFYLEEGYVTQEEA